MGSENREKVIVVGAGIAGIAAARSLQNQGYAVTILEGRNRIGGRVWTDDSLGVPIDLGASWIHGIQGNPIAQLAQKWRVDTVTTDYDQDLVYGADGQPVPASWMQSIYDQAEQLLEQAETFAEEQDHDLSIAAAIAKVLPRSKILSATHQRALAYAFKMMIEHEEAVDLTDLSMWWSQEYQYFPGDEVIFPQGYRQIINRLAHGLDIRLEHFVTEIRHTDQKVTILTSQGTFIADRAIITLPIGVLKKGIVQFVPALPAPKQAAINHLSMGTLDKVIMRFPYQFWDKQPHIIGYLAPEPDSFMDFLNLAHFLDQPILLAFCAGKLARTIEEWTDPQIIAHVMRSLRAMYTPNIPEPTTVQITRWTQDPFAYGSYSAIPVGATLEDLDILAAPIKQRLFFAGEATHRQHYATVHGAYLSGIREAQRIITLSQPHAH